MELGAARRRRWYWDQELHQPGSREVMTGWSKKILIIHTHSWLVIYIYIT